jgi:hypothetical protein
MSVSRLLNEESDANEELPTDTHGYECFSVTRTIVRMRRRRRWLSIYIELLESKNCFTDMNRLRLFNEAFLSLPPHSLFLESMQFDCVSDTKIWLISHFFIARLIDMYLVLDMIVLSQMIIVLYFPHCFEHARNFFERSWLDVRAADTYSLRMIVLGKELKLIFEVYF